MNSILIADVVPWDRDIVKDVLEVPKRGRTNQRNIPTCLAPDSCLLLGIFLLCGTPREYQTSLPGWQARVGSTTSARRFKDNCASAQRPARVGSKTTARRFKDHRASVGRPVRIDWHSSCTKESVVSLSCELELRYDHHHKAKELEDIK